MIFSRTWVLFAFILTPLSFASSKLTHNPKSKEFIDETPLKELLASQYFKLSAMTQVEVKSLKGFVLLTNDSETLKCSFFKDKIPNRVKLEIASGSRWENHTGPTIKKAPSHETIESNSPESLHIQFAKGRDSIDLRCEFNNHLIGQFENSGDEERQRNKCENRGGTFTRFSRKEYDYACDYNLKYGDLKKLLGSAGLSFESRVEPPQISVVVLGQDRPKKGQKRAPSSVKLK